MEQAILEVAIAVAVALAAIACVLIYGARVDRAAK